VTSPDEEVTEAAPLGGGSISRRKLLGGLAAGGVVLGVPGTALAQQRRNGGRGSGRNGPGGGRRRRDGQDGAGVSGDDSANSPAQFSRMFDDVVRLVLLVESLMRRTRWRRGRFGSSPNQRLVPTTRTTLRRPRGPRLLVSSSITT